MTGPDVRITIDELVLDDGVDREEVEAAVAQALEDRLGGQAGRVGARVADAVSKEAQP